MIHAQKRALKSLPATAAKSRMSTRSTPPSKTNFNEFSEGGMANYARNRVSTGTWTDEAIELAKKGWREGLSASQIVYRLAVGGFGAFTRNAVIGKVHRLGLAGRATPSRPATPPQAVQARPAAPRVYNATVIKEPYIPLPEPLTPTVSDVLALSAHQCRWPMEPQAEGEGFSFCGREAQGAYCEAHAARSRSAQPKKHKPSPMLAINGTLGRMRS